MNSPFPSSASPGLAAKRAPAEQPQGAMAQFFHGSEEYAQGRSKSEARTAEPQGATNASVPLSPLKSSLTTSRSPVKAATDAQLIASLNMTDLSAYLEFSSCSEETIHAVQSASIDGELWCGICNAPDADRILETDLQIESRIQRIKLINECSKKVLSKSSAEQQTGESKQKKLRRFTDVPQIPISDSTTGICSTTDWRNHGITISGWLDMFEPRLSTWASFLFANPEQDMSVLRGNMTEAEIELDNHWANEILKNERNKFILKSIMAKPEKYQLDGHNSGLQICASLGMWINKKTTRRSATMMRSCVTRPPVEKAADLYSEVLELEDLFGKMSLQGAAVSNDIKYAAVFQAVSKLIEKPELQYELGSAVYKCEESNPGDGTELLAVVTECAQDILINRGLEAGKPKSSDVKARARGADSGSLDLRKRLTTVTAALEKIKAKKDVQRICPNFRENNACPNGEACKQKHVASGNTCDNAHYVSTGICDDFTACTNKHPWDLQKFGPKSVALEKWKEQRKAKGKVSAMVMECEELAMSCVMSSSPETGSNSDESALPVKQQVRPELTPSNIVAGKRARKQTVPDQFDQERMDAYAEDVESDEYSAAFFDSDLSRVTVTDEAEPNKSVGATTDETFTATDTLDESTTETGLNTTVESEALMESLCATATEISDALSDQSCDEDALALVEELEAIAAVVTTESLPAHTVCRYKDSGLSPGAIQQMQQQFAADRAAERKGQQQYQQAGPGIRVWISRKHVQQAG
jgi:hypothetical protein